MLLSQGFPGLALVTAALVSSWGRGTGSSLSCRPRVQALDSHWDATASPVFLLGLCLLRPVLHGAAEGSSKTQPRPSLHWTGCIFIGHLLRATY